MSHPNVDPGVADVMGWYWDPKAEEEVCLLDERRSRRRAFGSHEKTAEMSHCKQRATESFAGNEGGTHGTTVSEHLFLSLEERLASSHLGESSQQQEVSIPGSVERGWTLAHTCYKG